MCVDKEVSTARQNVRTPPGDRLKICCFDISGKGLVNLTQLRRVLGKDLHSGLARGIADLALTPVSLPAHTCLYTGNLRVSAERKLFTTKSCGVALMRV
jgi:hypothetical protein